MYEQAILTTRQQTWEQTYPGAADQLRHVRGVLRDFLGTCPVADDAVYLLNELAANAIVHSDSGKTGGIFTIRVRHLAGHHVEGEVEDQGSNWNGDLPASAEPPHGLFLLANLASACGVKQAGRAHVVWFRLDYPGGTSSPSHPTGGQPVAIAHLTSLAATPEQAAPQLAAVADSVTGHRIIARLSRIGDVLVLTIEEPAGGLDSTAISISPDVSTPDLPLECTCLWILAPDATPEAIGQALIAILNAIRP